MTVLSYGEATNACVTGIHGNARTRKFVIFSLIRGQPHTTISLQFHRSCLHNSYFNGLIACYLSQALFLIIITLASSTES